jgi:hypothetical protein
MAHSDIKIITPSQTGPNHKRVNPNPSQNKTQKKIPSAISKQKIIDELAPNIPKTLRIRCPIQPINAKNQKLIKTIGKN